MAAVLAVSATLSPVLARLIGLKFTVAGGLAGSRVVWAPFVAAACSLLLCRDVTFATLHERHVPQNAAKTCGQRAVKRS